MGSTCLLEIQPLLVITGNDIYYLFLPLPERINITQRTQDQEVSVGESVNFTCSARGTDISIFWEIRGTEYWDCSTPGFCVTDTTKEGSAESSSRFEITTGEDMIGQPISVRCVVEQRFGDREVSQNSSTAQLTVISPTSKSSKPGIITGILLPWQLQGWKWTSPH